MSTPTSVMYRSLVKTLKRPAAEKWVGYFTSRFEGNTSETAIRQTTLLSQYFKSVEDQTEILNQMKIHNEENRREKFEKVASVVGLSVGDLTPAYDGVDGWKNDK